MRQAGRDRVSVPHSEPPADAARGLGQEDASPFGSLLLLREYPGDHGRCMRSELGARSVVLTVNSRTSLHAP